VAISQEDFKALRQRDPLEAFDLSGSLVFSKNFPKYSTVSAGGMLESSKEDLLEEFHTKILEVNLFQAIEQDSTDIPGLKNLFRKLNKSSLAPKLIELTVELEPLLD